MPTKLVAPQNPRRSIEAELRALVRRVVPDANIYFPRRGWGAGVSWNGRHLRPTGQTLESQLHEIAHVLVAPEERRRLPELGLGPDPYRRNFVERVVPREIADDEELDTVTMQLVLARLFALDEAAIEIEMHTTALTRERVLALRGARPWALPDTEWARVIGSFSS
jgi:hypothetical protein